MSKFALAFRSRTFWTVVVMVLVNIIPGLPIDQPTKDLITTVLGLVATYFHVNPSQNYNPPPLNGSTIDTAPPTNA
jgi:hypothetical protein